jgi:ABC-type glycerol-3-phosphate transport system permease component
VYSPAFNIQRSRFSNLLRMGGAYAIVILFSAFAMFPFLWMLVSSLKPLSEIFVGDSFFPANPSLANYQRLFAEYRTLPSLWNSFYIATVSTVLSVFLCALGGYGFAKFNFPGSNALFYTMLGTMTIPFVVLLVPLFIMMRNVFNWIDTPWPLIIPGAASAFGVFFMRQYMLSLSDEMLDAARIDGASEFGIFLRIVLPVSLPGLTSLAIIFFMGSWNNFLWPLAVLRSPDTYTLPLLLNSIQGPTGRFPFEVLMAGSVISVLPLIIIFLFLQRYLIEGLTAGSVKG